MADIILRRHAERGILKYAFKMMSFCTFVFEVASLLTNSYNFSSSQLISK